jgi:hypothetical protein
VVAVAATLFSFSATIKPDASNVGMFSETRQDFVLRNSNAKQRRARVFNMFNFNNEEMQTMARLIELRDVVDVFIVGITDGGVMQGTTRGWSPHALLERAVRRAGTRRAQVHVVNISFHKVHDPRYHKLLPPSDLAEIESGESRIKWYRETLMRSEMMAGFDELGGTDTDLITIADADEIVDATMLADVVATWDYSHHRLFLFENSITYRGSLNCYTERHMHSLMVSKMFSGATARTWGTGSFRGPCKSIGMYSNCTRYADTKLIREWSQSTFPGRIGQWHMSWMGGFAHYVQKKTTVAEGNLVKGGGGNDLVGFAKMLNTIRCKTPEPGMNMNYPFLPKAIAERPELFRPMMMTTAELIEDARAHDPTQ